MVEGVNNTQVELVWNFTATSAFIVSIARQRVGDSQSNEQIVGRSGSTAFEFPDESLKTDYEAQLPATLVIKDVNRTHEYEYSLTVLTSLGVQKLFDIATVDVLCK